MGYTIKVGEAYLESQFESKYSDEPSAYWYVKDAEHPEAPYSIDSEHTNARSPSYTVWAEFARSAGLHDFFFNKETGKMRNHPGTFQLTEEDAKFVTTKLQEYRAAHPEAEACFCECAGCNPWMRGEELSKAPPHNPRADNTLVRLVWLEFWVRWAVTNCEKPAIHNG